MQKTTEHGQVTRNTLLKPKNFLTLKMHKHMLTVMSACYRKVESTHKAQPRLIPT